MTDVVAAFLSQAKTHANLTAVEHAGTRTTYRELATLSRQLAAALDTTVNLRPKVFLATPPSPRAYAGMIGTLMLDGTFCPIDTNGPPKRISAILDSFDPDVIVYDGIFPEGLCADDKVVPIIDLATLPADASELGKPPLSQNEAAYVVFTSGSTGQPKGVRIARKAFSHFVQIAQSYFCTRPGERWGQFSNLGYDIAVMDVFMALCHGATLVTFSTPTDRILPGRAIRNHHINIWQSVPSVVDQILASDSADQNLVSLRVMSFCGEPLLSDRVGRLFQVQPELVIFNTYGATETTGFNTVNRLTVDNCKASCDRPIVSLGSEVPGWAIRLEDGPSQNEGQIVVCGENLSLGYWEDDTRTAASFRDLGQRGQRYRGYFTGDWGERVGNQLYFRGRIDRQVKVKGERIELDEIDFRLRDAGFMVAASVLCDEAIYSFVETQGSIDETRIRSRLAEYLPFHAVPKRVLAVERLPRNANGKIAYAELPTMLTKLQAK